MTATVSAESQAIVRRRAHKRLWELALRHPILTVGIVAFSLRILMALGLNFFGVTGLVQDDRVYIALVRSKVDGTLGSLDSYYGDLYSATWVFTSPLTLVSRIFGMHVLVGQVVIALWGTLTAVATASIAFRMLSSRRLALFAGMVPALLPSQILWSSVWLKDAAVSACLALVVLGLTIVTRAPVRTERGVGLMTTAAGLVGLSGLRLNTFVLACWCVAAVVLFFYWRKPAILVMAVLLLVVGPWLGGAGILGSKALSRSDELGTQRAAGAANAESALVDPIPADTSTGADAGATGADAGATGADAGATGADAGATGADASATSEGAGANDFSTNLRHLPSGAIAVLLRPFPWDGSTSRASTFAKLDNLLWYPIVAFAVLGVWKARRRKEMVLIVLLIAGTVTVYGLSEGNLGTAFRHRGEVVWATGLLSCVFLDGRGRRRRSFEHAVDGHPPEIGALSGSSR